MAMNRRGAKSGRGGRSKGGARRSRGTWGRLLGFLQRWHRQPPSSDDGAGQSAAEATAGLLQFALTAADARSAKAVDEGARSVAP